MIASLRYALANRERRFNLVVTILLVVLIAVPLGVIAAHNHGTWVDRFVMGPPRGISLAVSSRRASSLSAYVERPGGERVRVGKARRGRPDAPPRRPGRTDRGPPEPGFAADFPEVPGAFAAIMRVGTAIGSCGGAPGAAAGTHPRRWRREMSMGFLGFGGKGETHLVVVIREGPSHLRLNGNQVRGSRIKKKAAVHPAAVCWIEFSPAGGLLDQGLGPAAGHLAPGEAERLLRELPQAEACRLVLRDLAQGPEHAARWLPWGPSAPSPRGSVGEQGRA